MTDEYANQPSVNEWKFIDQLKSPLHSSVIWRRQEKNAGEASLKAGVSLEFTFPDDAGMLDTAYDDFRRFLIAGKIRTDGAYRISTVLAPTTCFEEYILDVGETSCRVLANDTEGIRRGLVFLEDSITGTGGPFLKMGITRRKPFIKTRVSRCFFGPIKRPPLNRDELLDDVNYYPDEYLNRLVHEGINGLWLSIEFRDYPSRFFPEHGRDAVKRLEKLRATVKQCARYGIKIYIYCNEPWSFSDKAFGSLPLAELEANPWFKGHEADGTIHFCTSSKEGQAYVEECSNYLFTNVPDLGGMICIVNGEIPTNCYSYPGYFFGNNCPRCSKLKPWEVYHDLLAAFARGIKNAAPKAEFIAWFYTPSITDDSLSTKEQKFEVFRQIAAHAPKDVIMQMNFESNGIVKQCGRELVAHDYWLSWPGPSDIFTDWASNATQKSHARVSAKIQVGCSHEDATIPFMPVPGSLYRKYRVMKELGVDSVMQCWYFGNYPGLMNKAAGELSFLPFAAEEDEFLENLARIDWAGNQKQIAQVWKYFMNGYAHFPVTIMFSWYGPLHCSIVWPLHLFPVDQPIAPSWCFGYPDSGDRIGECTYFAHSLPEILDLLTQMNEQWQKGIDIISLLEDEYAGNEARQMDIGLYKAIGLQIRSALDVFTFYHLRERLPFMEQAEQRTTLRQMIELVQMEIKNCMSMKALCLKDPRLGFHSEAEGYKFFPFKLDWRVKQLENLLETDFPKVAVEIEQGNHLFPEYTGVKPVGKTYGCGQNESDAPAEAFFDGTGSWKAWHDDKMIHFEVRCIRKPDDKESIALIIEPRRLDPVIRLDISAGGVKSYYQDPWDAAVRIGDDEWTAVFSVPFQSIPWYDRQWPLRINVCHYSSGLGQPSGWIEQHPLPERLTFGDHNSADLGWLFIKM